MLVINLIISSLVIIAAGEESCRGSTGFDGICTYGINCYWIYQQGLARSNQCGYTNGKLKVCCPRNHFQTITTSTTTEGRSAAVALSGDDSCTVSTGSQGTCVPTYHCPWIHEQNLARSNRCRYANGVLIVCCPNSRISDSFYNSPTPPSVGNKAQTVTKYCTGSTGYSGKCINTRQCPWIHRNGLTRENQCEYVQGILHVCCPEDEVDAPVDVTPHPIQYATTTEAYTVGSGCKGSTGFDGVCVFGEHCPWVYEQGIQRSNICGYDGDKLMVCCPMDHATPPPDDLQSFGYDSKIDEETCNGTSDGIGYCVLVGDCRGIPADEQSEICDLRDGMAYKCCPAKYAFHGEVKMPEIEKNVEATKIARCDLSTTQKGYCVPLEDCHSTDTPTFCESNSAVGVIYRCCHPRDSFHNGKRLPSIQENKGTPCFNAPPSRRAGFCVTLDLCPDFPQVNDNTPHLCGYTSDHHKQFCCPNPDNLPDPYKKEKLMVTKLKKDCGFGGNFKISNGEDAGLGDWPWIAALFYEDVKRFRCGGSLISEKFVLTAGHCVESSLRLTEVRLGEWNILTELDCIQPKVCAAPPQVFKPKRIIIHPKYQVINKIALNDIALIELDRYVEFTDWVRPVCLDDGSVDRKNKSAIVMGWGRTGKSRVTDILQILHLPIVRNSECLRIWWAWNVTFTTREHMCAGGIPGKDSCKGDSGGPLVVPVADRKGRYFQIGVVSYGLERCGGKTTAPSVYADIQRYYFWILQEISKFERLT